MGLEQVIRPFAEEDATGAAYVPPGTVGVPPAIVLVGFKGGTNTFTGHYSYSLSFKLGAVHSENSTDSAGINDALQSAAS